MEKCVVIEPHVIRALGPVGVMGNNKYKTELIKLIVSYSRSCNMSMSAAVLPDPFLERYTSNGIDHAVETIIMMGVLNGGLITKDIFLAGLFHDISLHHGGNEDSHHELSAEIYSNLYASDWEDIDLPTSHADRDGILYAIRSHAHDPSNISYKYWQLAWLLSVANKMLLLDPKAAALRSLGSQPVEERIDDIKNVLSRIITDDDIVSHYIQTFGTPLSFVVSEWNRYRNCLDDYEIMRADMQERRLELLSRTYYHSDISSAVYNANDDVGLV